MSEAPQAAAIPSEPAAEEDADEDVAAPTQSFALIVTERGVPLTGLAGNAWTQDAADKVVGVDPVAPTPETEVIDVDLEGRSFSYPEGEGTASTNLHKSPWQMLVVV